MKILMNFRAFPIAMGRWFEFAFKDLGHKVIVAGPSMGDQVPWPGEHHYPQYNFQPDILLPDWEKYPLQAVLDKLTVQPDLVIQAGDTCWLEGKAPDGIKNVILATDPHCIDYHPRLKDADHFFCMQRHYMMENYQDFKNKTWIPYAYYPPVHKELKGTLVTNDIVFCGLPYEKRTQYLTAAAEKGWKVFNKLGPLYKEYAEAYNSGIIAFNCSSLLDVPARFWEGLAMGNLVLTNIVPELQIIGEKFGIKPFEHYVPYSSIEDALEKTEHYLKHPEEASKIARAGRKKVQGQTYYQRAEEILWTIR